jgi:hypothetical protein
LGQLLHLMQASLDICFVDAGFYRLWMEVSLVQQQQLSWR